MMSHNPEIMTGISTIENLASLTTGQKEKFELFKENLLSWNERMNLTAITDEEGIWHKHFHDSLTLLPLLPAEPMRNSISSADPMRSSRPLRMIDVGSGAGFPGIPIKILRPDIELTLLDSLRKRVFFLQDTVSRLELQNVECVHSRAEDFIREENRRGGYDICTARAVARLDKLCRWCLPFLAPGGLFYAMKGPSPEDEVNDALPIIRKIGGEVVGIEYMEILPGMVHSVVIVCYTEH